MGEYQLILSDATYLQFTLQQVIKLHLYSLDGLEVSCLWQSQKYNVKNNAFQQ
jgi:hypothetical protein